MLGATLFTYTSLYSNHCSFLHSVWDCGFEFGEHAISSLSSYSLSSMQCIADCYISIYKEKEIKTKSLQHLLGSNFIQRIKAKS